METLLDLARAHADLGEIDAARELCEEIVSRADRLETRHAAQDLLDWTRDPDGDRRP